MTTKSLLRKTLLEYRRLLSPAEYEKRNQQLLIQLITFLKDHKSKNVHCFLPIVRNKEFDIRPALNEIWNLGLKTITSRTDFDKKSLDHFWLDSSTKLRENSLGIPEPINGKSASIKDADTVLVPLVALDKMGNRIGYGGGFYDRLLQNFDGMSIGISLTPLFDELGTDSWDVGVKEQLFYKCQ